MVRLLVTIAFIPILNVLLPLFNCIREGENYISASLQKETGDKVVCFSGIHLGYLVPACLLLVVFLVIAISASLTLHAWDPATRGLLNRVHSRTETVNILLKLYLSGVFLFDRSGWIPVASLVVVGFVYLGTGLYYLRFHRPLMNYLFTGLDMMFLWGALCAALTRAFPGSLPLAVVFGVGLPGAYVVGHRLAHWRLRSLSVFPPPGGVDGSFDQMTAHLHFSFPADVEISTRFLYLRPVDDSVRRYAHHIYERGLQEFPRSELVLMSYIHFLTFFTPYIERVMALEGVLRAVNPGFDARFFLYRHARDVENSEHGGSIVSLIEFTNRLKLAVRHHVKALYAIDWFWTALAYIGVENVKGVPERVAPIRLEELSNILHAIDVAELSAEKYYESLLTKFYMRPKLLRAVAAFLFAVKNRPNEAEALVARADEVEKLEALQVSGADAGGDPSSVRGNASSRRRMSVRSEEEPDGEVAGVVSGIQVAVYATGKANHSITSGRTDGMAALAGVLEEDLVEIREEISMWRLQDRISTGRILQISGYLMLFVLLAVIAVYCVELYNTYQAVSGVWAFIFAASSCAQALTGGVLSADLLAQASTRELAKDYAVNTYSAIPIIGETYVAADEAAPLDLLERLPEVLHNDSVLLQRALEAILELLQDGSPLYGFPSIRGLRESIVSTHDSMTFSVTGGALPPTVLATSGTFLEAVSQLAAFFDEVTAMDPAQLSVLLFDPSYVGAMLTAPGLFVSNASIAQEMFVLWRRRDGPCRPLDCGFRHFVHVGSRDHEPGGGVPAVPRRG